MFQEVMVNVVANIIAASVLTVIGVSTFVVYFVLNRQKLLRFLGISRRNPHLSIVVSRLEIKPNGTTGFEPLTKGFYGPGIIRIEYKGALLVRDMLRSSLLARLPKGFQGWLRRRYVALAHIDPPIDVSPQTLDEVPSDNLILLGSGIYNIARFC